MEIKRKMKWCTIILAAVLFMFGFAGSSFCQDPTETPLIFKPEMEIENYARTGYNLYGRTQIGRSSNARYDEFGNYLMNGVNIFQWDEEKINSRHVNLAERYSILDKLNPIDENEYFYMYLDELVVLSESNKAFSSRFIVGNRIRVKFSPLTLDMAAFNGIRWDFKFADNDLTLLSSRIDMPLWHSATYSAREARNRLLPVYLIGGHIERKLGIINVAANYINTYKSDSALSRSNNSFTGTLAGERWGDPYMVLERTLQIVVKLEDGSRFDGGGPRIYEIYPEINGVARKDLLIGVSQGTWENDMYYSRKPNDPNRELYTNRWFLDSLRIPDLYEFNKKYGDPSDRPENILARRYGIESDPILFSDLNDEGKNYLECNGEEYLLFWFEIPQDDNIKDVRFKALVENNYIFSISEVYDNDTSISVVEEIGGGVKNASATYFEPILYSEGDIKDGSNLSWVSFQYGRPTANMLMSLRVDTEFKGLKFISEYSRNLRYKQYAHQKASKFREDSEAYYFNLLKEYGDFTFGAEYFKMDPDYSTNIKITDKAYNEVQLAWQDEYYADPYMRGNKRVGAGPQEFMNLTQIIETVDDNDDRDPYPDFHLYSAVRDRNGIFPGLDRNGNNRPDTNENDNLMPDYAEPFFLYNVDPDEYDYGLDLNNNGTIDIREDDDKSDYPYNLNSKGYHVFGSYGSDMGWKYTLGYIDMGKIAGGGITDVKYGVAEYNKFIPFFADLKFSTTLKKVEDSITDNIFKYARELSTTLIDSTSYGYNLFDTESNFVHDDIMHEKYYDPLRYRDSYVSKTYFETNLFKIQNLNIGMKFKYEINHQNETLNQDKNDIIERTQIYRADYRYYLKGLLIQPQVKFLSRKYTNGDGLERIFHEEYFYPILKVEYPLTLNTTFRVGMQGFPGGLHATVRNLMNDQLDYDTRNYVIMLSNKSFYSGYDFCLNFGYRSSWQEYNGIARKAYDRTERIYFVRLIVGLEPIS